MPGSYVVGTYSDDFGHRPDLVVELCDGVAGPVVKFAERPSPDTPPSVASEHAVSVSAAALATIVPCFERRLGLAQPEPQSGLVARYVACVTALAGQGHRELSEVTGWL
jgi:hypothetical protein